MQDICILCGRDFEERIEELLRNNDAVQSEIHNLEEALRNLRNNDSHIYMYIQNKEKLCTECGDVLEGIEFEEDKKLLEERINARVEEIEETVEDMLEGQE